MDELNQDFIEQYDVVVGLAEDSLQNPASGNPADWISVKDFHSIIVIIVGSGTGTSGADDVTIELHQNTAESGSGHKPLPISEYYTKVGNQAVVGAEYTVKRDTPFTRVALDSPMDEITFDGSGQPEFLFVTEVRVIDMDINNDFTFLRAFIQDSGTNTQRGSVYYLGSRRIYSGIDDPRRL